MLQTDKYALKALGTADDQQEANGVDVLTFYEAQGKARDAVSYTHLTLPTILRV